MGARFSIHPMADDFVDLILGALESVEPGGLTVETDTVSTYLAGPEDDLVRYIVEATAAVARSGVHTVAQVLLSRGCPGEMTCELSEGELPVPAELTPPLATGLRAEADWSLYPLSDGGEGIDHMAEIEKAITDARRRGVEVDPRHYATRLRGDLAEVVSAACQAWMAAGASVPHVTTHLTLSLNSPTGGG